MTVRRTSSGRALSPTRERILRIIEELARPIAVPELTENTGLHENTVRGHVVALWNDGYLIRSQLDSPETPGRPAWLWSVTPRTPSSPYAALASALAEQLAQTSPDPTREARQAGLGWGKALAERQDSTLTAHEHIISIMRDEGFAPESHPEQPEILLKQCPLIEAATKHPEIVCAVHLGMIEGALETKNMNSAGTTLTPFTAPGTCTLHLKITPATKPNSDRAQESGPAQQSVPAHKSAPAQTIENK